MIKIGDFELHKYTLVPIFLGFTSAIAVALMIQLYNVFNYIFQTIIAHFSYHLIICFPLLGLTISFALNHFFAKHKEDGCGTDLMIESYHHRNGIIEIKDVLVKTFSSTITLGFGGSGGLEGPSLLLGGGVSSYILQKLRLKPKEIKLLYLCGASAGFTALFKAPLTGILLALEIPYKKDLEKDAFIPAALSSISAYIFSVLFFGGESIFSTRINVEISTNLLFHTIFLGIITSILAIVFIKVLDNTKTLIQIIGSKLNILLSVMVGGIIIGLIGFFYPQVLGIGYGIIRESSNVSNYNITIQALFTLLVLKIIATSLTIASKGSVGLFIPSLYIGGICGLIYAKIFGLTPESLFAIIAMGSILAAASKSLLTGIAFVTETIGSSPIMYVVLSASISYFITGNYSFYESQLNKKPSSKMEALLELEEIFRKSQIPNLNISSLKLKKPVCFKADTTIKEALKTVRANVYRIYPIVNNKNQIIGSIGIESIFAIERDKWNMPISNLEMKKPLIATKEQTLIEIVKRMLETEEDHVFIVNDSENRIIEGVITAIDIIKIYVEEITNV
ncbi:MAG: chloride channel protein [Nitrososphaeria archaeon]